MISWFERHNKISWIITACIACTIFYISSLSFAGGGSSIGNYKATLYHIGIFFFLALFLAISLAKGKNKKSIILSVLIAVIYGALDEFHQSFVPSRNSSIKDIYLNSFGILLASAIYLIKLKFKTKSYS